MSGQAEDAVQQPVVVERTSGGALEARGHGWSMNLGGGDAGASVRSADLLLAALGSCVVGTMLVFAQNQDMRIDDVRVELMPTVRMRPERVARVDMTIDLVAELTDRQLASLRRVAGHCKIHNTLASVPELELKLRTS